MRLPKFEFVAAAIALGLSCATSSLAQTSGGEAFHVLPGSPGVPTNAPPPAKRAQKSKPAPVQAPRTYEEAERLYLDRKIDAVTYQKYLAEFRTRPPAPPPVAVQPAPLPPPIAVQQPPTAQRPSVPSSQPPTFTPPPPVGTPNNDPINSVEAKMDELIKKKEAREKATNALPPVATGPKSKRDRLNDLLRLYIDGKISEEEMKERRAKILAEP